jgi:excisionase family DNA binding protein
MRAKPDQLPQFMTIPEVQSFLGIKSRKTILKYINTGRLCAYKIGGTRWRIAGADVLAFLKAEFNAIADQPQNVVKAESHI